MDVVMKTETVYEVADQALRKLTESRPKHRVDVHVDATGMRRLRKQPRGTKDCACGRTISANKYECLSCAEKAGRA